MGLLFALLHTISQWLNSEEFLKGSISMKISTDLEQVKAVASAMLYMDVAKTEFSPIIVQHPFTSSGMVVAAKTAPFRCWTSRRVKKTLRHGRLQ